MGNCCSISADDFIPEYQKWDDHPARKEWELIKDLGAGSFSQVVLARNRTTGHVAALKVVFLGSPDMDNETRTMLSQEGEILAELHHPHLVSCSEVIRSPRALVFVLEYLAGCNVLDGLLRRSNKYTERDAAEIFVQLASAVAYLHSQGIIHRDIKPENLVYAAMPQWTSDAKISSLLTLNLKDKDRNNGNQDHPVVKLVDLGMAWRMHPNEVDRGCLGSAAFVAPEIILGGEHTPAMDIFGMGVLLFIMLVGRKPFNIAESENLKYGKMSLAEAPGLKDPRWLDLSPDAKDLLMGMLSFNPKRRFTAEQVLAHEWISRRRSHSLRLLGEDVALGAATVAEVRRLRFLCSGTVALQRAAGATAKARHSTNNKKMLNEVGEGSTKEHVAYLEELRRSQRYAFYLGTSSALIVVDENLPASPKAAMLK